MKKKLLLIFVPLLLSTSFASYAAGEAGQAQQKMNRFQSAIKQFQKKIKFYQRCMQGKCTQEEKVQAQAELKKAAKIAIPTALGVIVVVIGGVVVYKKYGESIRYVIDVLRSDKQNEKVYDAIKAGNLDEFKKLMNTGFANTNLDIIAYWIISTKNNPNSVGMIKMLVEKYPNVKNTRKTDADRRSLISNAIFNEQNDIASFLVDQEDIEIRPEGNVFLTPLFMAAHKGLDQLLKAILQKYKSNSIENKLYDDLIAMFEKKDGLLNLSGKLYHSQDEVNKAIEKTIAKIKETATQEGFFFD